MSSGLRAVLTGILVTALTGAVYAHGKEQHPKTHHGKSRAPAAERSPHEAGGATTTLTGEVMDLACYVQHADDGQGPEHASCARQCINRGLPAGLKVGDTLYLLLGRGHDSIVDLVAPLAGKEARVTGVVANRDGMKTLVVHKAEEVRVGP